MGGVLQNDADIPVAKAEMGNTAAKKFTNSAAAARVADEFGRTCAGIGNLSTARRDDGG